MDAGATIAAVRRRRGWTLRRLAAGAGTSHATLSQYEHGTKTPNVDTLDRIVRAAGFEPAIELRPSVVADDRQRHARGRELADVLTLAEQFPARHAAALTFPVFGRP
jgi:transcriptional regulator with XRE-family HTH domain